MALTDVTTKFKGWIEKLHVNATGQLVMRAIRCSRFTRLISTAAQREYLLALGDHER